MHHLSMEGPRGFEIRYWVPFFGYLEAARHNPVSLNFLENTALYFALGFAVRQLPPSFLPIALVIFPMSAAAEWFLFSRLKPKRLGWDRLDAESFVWEVWQAFCFFLLGMMV
jgi:hypothetical protein